MADSPILMSALLLLLILDYTFGGLTLSDYKICGDPGCERPMSRVLATKSHKGTDCRFLNFKRGDVIFVFHKLSGKRDDLWAGAIDKKFGYFPKEAVDIEEIYTQEEIKTQTQEQDFFCIDAYGMITDSELNNHANQNEDEGASEDVKQHEKESKSIKEAPSTTEKNEFTELGEDSQTLVKVNPDNVKQKSTEQGGSYWIGSRVTGWLGLGDQSDDSSQEQTGEQDSFRSRKLSLDIDGNQLGKGPPAEASGWLTGRLTNIFGFGKRNPEVNVEETNERDKLTHQNIDQSSTGTQSVEKAHEDEPLHVSSWLNIGFGDFLSFNKGKDEKTGENKHPEETNVNEKIDIDNEIPASMHSILSQVGVDQDEKSKEAKEESSKRENTNIQHDERTGWYDSVYSSISSFYNKQPEVENGGITTLEHSHAAESHKPGSDEEEKGIYDESGKGMKSMFSADSILSMFSRLTLTYQPEIPDVNKDVQNNKESAAEVANEDSHALLEAQPTIDESIEGHREENVEDNTDTFEVGVESAENVYKTEPMPEQKLSSEEITLHNTSLDLQQKSNDYQSDDLDRRIGTLNDNIETEPENPESNNLESAVRVEPPDISEQLQDNREQTNSLQTETEQIQLLEKNNTDDKNVESVLLKSEQDSLDISDIPANMTESENFTDQVVILHSGDAVGEESTGKPIKSASTLSLADEKMSYVELTETETSKLDLEMEPEELKAHQSKDHSSENTQSHAADGYIRHMISVLFTDQRHTHSSTKASMHNQIQKSGFNEVDVQDSDTDETPKDIVTEESKVEEILNLISNKNVDMDISTEEALKIQEDEENNNADITVLKEQKEKHVPAKTVHFEGKNKYTSTGFNVENEMDIIDDLQLRTANEQNIQTNQDSLDAKLDPPSSTDVHKSNAFYENEVSKHRNKMTNIEQQSITEANLVNNGPGVHPAQDVEEPENYSAQQRDIPLKEIKSHDDIQYVDRNSEQKDPQNVKGDHDRLLPCSDSQTETCISFVDGENVYQTSAEQVKSEVPRQTVHTDQGEGFSNTTAESLDGEIRTKSQLGENTPNGKRFEQVTSETEQFTNDVEGEIVSPDNQPDNSVINYGNREAQANRFAHKIHREDNYKMNLNQHIDEVNCETASEKGEVLSEIHGNVVKEPSDKTEGDVKDSKFTSDKEDKVITVSHGTSYESDFPTTDENNTAHLVEDLHTDQGEGFSNTTAESLDGEIRTESQLGENTPNGKRFEQVTSETEQFTNDVEGEIVSPDNQPDNSVINYGNREAQANRFAHKIHREDNYKMNLNQHIDEVNCETASEKGEVLSEIHGSVVKEPSDKTEGDVKDSKFTSDKEDKVITVSHGTSYESDFPTTDENNTAHLVEDLHRDSPMKNMGEPLTEDRDIGEISQTKQYGDEMLLDPPVLCNKVQSQCTHSSQEAIKATQIFKEYKNMQVHLNAEDVQYFLDVFGTHKLLWLDYCLGNTGTEDEVENNDNNLAILSDFERILKYHSEIISTSTKSKEDDRNMKEEDIHKKNISLKKLEILLSTLRSKYTMAKPAVTINVIQEVGKPECTTANCFSVEKNDHTRRDNEAGLGVRDDSEEMDWRTGHNVEGAIVNTETSTQSTKKVHGVAEVNGAVFTFAGQLTFTALEKVSLIYSLLKWLITGVRQPGLNCAPACLS